MELTYHANCIYESCRRKNCGEKDSKNNNIVFQRGKYHISKEIAEGIIIDYTKEGKVISIEILDASKRMPAKSIKDVTVGIPIKAA